MIWSSKDRLNDTAREDYQKFQREVLEDESYEVSDEKWADEVYLWLDDERCNLNKDVDGVIVAFAIVGTWRGHDRVIKFLAATLPAYCNPNATKPSGTATAIISVVA